MPKAKESWGSGPEAPQPAPSETPVNKSAADQAAETVKPSAPGETGTTPGTNWK
ncbi:hypothetical protein SAMN05421819_2860 [Bryocella elongata]|uniref:Uncharacterized protein n=1 Tax=Bryocella elongata TaxID=863522 RepID=A0A1H6A2A5_9BACT|nr:hypothetical protein [Bryocella elongata]SEG42482.1 hypothetical protein SAMN05421819_2860 [Bryocella elongata]